MKSVCLMILTTVLLIVGTGCVKTTGSYYDGNVYERALYSDLAKRGFSYEGPLRNPVIVVHGLFGARLGDKRTGGNVWGDFALSEMMSGGKFPGLAHPMRIGTPLRLLKGENTAVGLLERANIKVSGLHFSLENYDALVRLLEESGFVPDIRPLPDDRHFPSQFVFYYDWRRDISENAVRLGSFIQEKRALLKERYQQLYGLKNYDVRFDLVGHSMGGLVVRYFLLYGEALLPDAPDAKLPAVTWAGAEHVDRVIIIGTPNAGYSDTLLELTEGLRMVRGAPPYPQAVIGTFVSYYQMLPDRESNSVIEERTGRPLDCFDPAVWDRFHWGILASEQDEYLKMLLPSAATRAERLAIAAEHLRKCLLKARQFKSAMKADAAGMPAHLQWFLFAGDGIPTNRTLTVSHSGEVTVKERTPGDGKITSGSATLDRRDGGLWQWGEQSPIPWHAVYFFPGAHMGLMNSDGFISNLRYILLSPPERK